MPTSTVYVPKSEALAFAYKSQSAGYDVVFTIEPFAYADAPIRFTLTKLDPYVARFGGLADLAAAVVDSSADDFGESDEDAEFYALELEDQLNALLEGGDE